MDLTELTGPTSGPSLGNMLYERQLMSSRSEGSSRQAEVRRIVIESVFERSSATISSVPNRAGYADALSQGPVLLSWLEEAPPEVRISGIRPTQQTTALLLKPLNYHLPETGRIELPVGTIPGYLSVTPREGGICGDASSTAVYIHQGEAIFEFTLPVNSQKIQVDNLKLALWSDFEGFIPPNIAIYNWQAEKWFDARGMVPGVNLIQAAAQLVNHDGKILVKLSTENNFQGGCYYLGMGLEGELH
jgi:hypothetical protein